jgi:hypothetical protein
MLYFSLCFFLLHGPMPDASAPRPVPAERLLALLGAATGLHVRRDAPDLDLVPVTFQEESTALNPRMLVLVLRAHGLYVHEIETKAGDTELLVTRSKKKPVPPLRMTVRVYAPKRKAPEDLIEALKATPEGAAVQIVLDSRTGKILLKADDALAVVKAFACLEGLDKSTGFARTYHLYRCDGMTVGDVHAAALRLLSAEARNRVVLVPYRPANTLMIGCGTDDWRAVLDVLRTVNPAGEVVEEDAEEGSGSR